MAEMYTATDDIEETLDDGRVIQIATKGSQIPMAEAVRLGLVKGKAQASPSKTKEASASASTGEASKARKTGKASSK